MSTTPTHPPICLRTMGSFHVGGRYVRLSGKHSYERTMSEGGQPVHVNPNGTYVVEQMYVQYYLPQHANGRGPLVLWHGGGMTGAVWEATPDGREGWVQHFLRQGWDVYVCDAVERGRSGFAPVPDVWPEGPVTQTMDDVYSRFRIGEDRDAFHPDPGQRRPYPGTRFPVAHFDAFCRQMVPRWTHTNQAMLDAFQALLARIGKATILCHSQSGPLAMRLAACIPEQLHALVAIEPAGLPELGSQAYETPTLVVLGGNIERDARWRTLSSRLDAFAGAHPAVTVLKLEERGVHGNSHVMMMDDNSDDIALLVHQWLVAKP